MAIHLIFGTQAAGKSTYAGKLSKRFNGVHLSIDEWMQDLYVKDLPRPINFKWIMERVERCEKRIWATTKQISMIGGNVVLDLGFMKAADRDKYVRLAKESNILMQQYYITAPYSIRLERVLKRNYEKGKTFAFEVTPEMFNYMEREFEQPDEIELKNLKIIDTTETNHQEFSIE